MSTPPTQGHSRTRSKAARPRTATKGPLDADEHPISVSGSQTSSPVSSRPSSTVINRASLVPPPHQALPIHPTTSPLASPRYPPTPTRPGIHPSSGVATSLPKDFSFLLRPEIYHPLTALNTPQPFRSSSKQPTPSTSIETLLANGHFRAAAIAAIQELTNVSHPIDPSDSQRIFSLLYTRLACLTLIDATSLAAQEVKAFEDLNNARYIDDTTGEHLVPWELRVLNVRLQALGFGDPRRAVMSYYELAREARDRIAKAKAGPNAGDVGEVVKLWTDRLYDLGVRVAGALVEMDDMVGAAHHLNTLANRDDAKFALAKALVWLQVGDTDAALECMKGVGESETGKYAEKVVLALCDMANAAYEQALDKWKALGEEVKDEMVGVNTAVCLLYLCRMGEGKELLEEMVGNGFTSHTLLFNLSTMYELCSDRHRDLKLKLAEKVAGLDEGPTGWEKTSADFKL